MCITIQFGILIVLELNVRGVEKHFETFCVEFNRQQFINIFLKVILTEESS